MDAPSDTTPDAGGHPIAVVSDRTGLSQDVLRVWERRYGAVHPRRGPGGQRYYSDADIDRLALLQAAMRAGRSIGQVATLDADALAALVAGDVAARDRRTGATLPTAGDAQETRAIVDAAVALARAMDAAGLDERLRRSAAAMGVAPFIETVAAPLLRRVGDEWHAGRLTPAAEHLVTALLHDIVASTMRRFPHQPGTPGVLVATPAGDRHAIGAALVGAAATVEGWRVLYLGADLPAGEIADAAIAAGVLVVAISVVYVEAPERVLAELGALRTRLPGTVTLLTGGAGARTLAAELAARGIEVAPSISGLAAVLRGLHGIVGSSTA